VTPAVPVRLRRDGTAWVRAIEATAARPAASHLVTPRGPAGWVNDVPGDTLELRPDGTFWLDGASDHLGSRGISGAWWPEAGRLRLTTEELRTAGGCDMWLDAVLDPVTGPAGRRDPGRWQLEALFRGGRSFSSVLARIRCRFAGSGTAVQPPGPPGRRPELRIRRQAPSLLAPGVSPLDAVWPVFDVTLTGTAAPAGAYAHPAELILAASADPPDLVNVSLACRDPVSPGWLYWSIEGMPQDAFASSRLRLEPVGLPPTWFPDGEAGRALDLVLARLSLEYDPDELTIRGVIEARDRPGQAYRAELAGRLRSGDVERLRRQLHRAGLPGRWRAVLGPLAQVQVPGAAVSACGEVASGDSPAGFLRYDRTQDLAAGLTGPPGEVVLALLERAGPGPDLSGFTAADAPALRHLAQSALADGLVAMARPLLDRVDVLLEADRQGALSRAMLLNFQLLAAVELHDFDAVVRHLRSAVQVRRYLLYEATPTDSAVSMLAAGVRNARSVLAIPGEATSGGPGAAGAGRLAEGIAILDGVDRAAGRLAGTEANAGEHLTGVDDLLKALDDGAARLDALAGQELAEDAGLLGRDTARLRHDLIMNAFPLDSRDHAGLDAVEAAEQKLLEAIRTRADVDRAAREAYLGRYQAASLLHLAAFTLQRAAATARQMNLPAARDEGRGTSRTAAANLTGYLERWRSTLAQDSERIQVVEAGQGFYTELVRLMLDIDAPREALLGAELARGRAFADLLAAGPRAARPAEGVTANLAELDEVCRGLPHPVLEYMPLDDELVIWRIDPGGDVTVHREPLPRAVLEEALAGLAAQLAAPRIGRAGAAELRAALDRLGGWLWPPAITAALPRDPDAPVIVVPHGPLLRLPFAALRRDGEYLLERHAVAHAPALLLLGMLARGRAGRDPVVSPQAARCVVIAKPVPMPRPDLEPLPWTAADLDLLTACYPAEGVTRHIGPDATAANLRASAAACDVLILATHASVAESADLDPISSFVALAPADGDDGVFTARDVMDLRTDADLVILAACRTGDGRLTADGLIGLSRAFLARGPSTLLMTLSDVHHEIALDIVALFHQHWRAGVTRAAALGRAQREWAAWYEDQPQLWAPFLMYGLP